jgi:hypothetical protein
MFSNTKIAIVLLAILLATCSGMLWADMGAIPVVVNVDVFEPNQRAFIAWNGQEEILILSTDLQASEPTKVLEVIPMPSEPKVKAGDTKVFEKAVNLLNEKLPKRQDILLPAGVGEDAKEAKVPPVAEITFHKKIGATDISVVHVLSKKGFIEWVETYLKGQNVQNPTIPEIMKTTVQEYLDDGYGWFAFNVVSLDKAVKSKEAVQYRFKTDSLFYPMRISRTDKGDTNVSLIILTNAAFDNLAVTGIPEGKLKVAYSLVTASDSELEKISPDCYLLLGKPLQAKLRVWETQGKLASFNEDIVAGRERSFSLKRATTGEVYGPFPLKRQARLQVGKNVFTLLTDEKSPANSDTEYAPIKLVLKREGSIVTKSKPFAFSDGAEVVLDKETFVLTRGKAPVARDPSEKANSATRPAAK